MRSAESMCKETWPLSLELLEARGVDEPTILQPLYPIKDFPLLSSIPARRISLSSVYRDILTFTKCDRELFPSIEWKSTKHIVSYPQIITDRFQTQ